jgi:hypothetical protein
MGKGAARDKRARSADDGRRRAMGAMTGSSDISFINNVFNYNSKLTNIRYNLLSLGT